MKRDPADLEGEILLEVGAQLEKYLVLQLHISRRQIQTKKLYKLMMQQRDEL